MSRHPSHKHKIILHLFLLIAALLNNSARAQTPAPPLSFEAASIHPAQKCTDSSLSPPGSRYFNVTNVSMGFLISMAWAVSDDQIENYPPWIESTCYSIEARAAGEDTLSQDQLHLLLQNLLADRFHLTLHRETKDIQGYALVIARNGPKLEPAKGGGAPNGHIGLEGLQAHNVSMHALASMLHRPASAHVIDQTGIKGSYDINLSFAWEIPSASDSSLPSLFTAVQEQLGLKLQSQKVPVLMLVIDHIEKTPTEN